VTATAPLITVPALAMPASMPAQAYFERPGPAALILGSFFALTLPMAAVELLQLDARITWLYIWLFGMTHFVITLTIYCQSANLKHFLSSRRTVITFLVVPALIFITFDLIHALRISAVWPLAALVFFGAVRLFDFFHLNRQTFGVLQMFKGRTKVKYPAALRAWENRLAYASTALLMTTFASGGVCPLLQAGGALSLADVTPLAGGMIAASITVMQCVWIALALAVVGTFAKIASLHQSIVRANPGRNCHNAFAYIALQAASAAMAAFYFPLYIAALAMHYVEYHVLMMPRCLNAKLDEQSAVDRAYDKLRRHAWVFYGVIVVLAGIVSAGAFVGMNAAMGTPISDFSSPIPALMMIAIFDGIFVFHYFVEMYIWKFSDPHFRAMLNGLYFSPAAKST
jgi:uncharacterized membrane protein